MNPLIGLAGSFATSALSGMFASKQQRQSQQFAQAQALQNQDIQRQNWETAMREGAARQVAGMKAAGLNPAMMQGGVPATPPLSSSPGSVVNGNPVSVPDFARSMNESEVAEAQSRLLNSQASDQEFKNGPLYRTLVLQGMDQEIALGVSREAANYSGIALNEQSIAESVSRECKNFSDMKVNDATIQKFSVDNVQTLCKCADILQGIKESEQRIVAMRAKSDCDRALAGLYKAAKSGQEITNEMLGYERDDIQRTYTARSSILDPVRDANGKETGQYRSYWGTKAYMETASIKMTTEMLDYNLRVLETLTPEERQKYLMNLDAGHLAVDALNALSGAGSRLGPHSTTTQREYHAGGYWERVTSD